MRHPSRIHVYIQYIGVVKDVILSCSYEYGWKLLLGPYILNQTTDLANKYYQML